MDALPGATRPAPQVWHCAYPILGRAIALREALQECWPMATCLPSAGGWAGPTAPGSNLSANSPALSKNTSRRSGLLETRLTNAAIEAINGILQMAKRIARGFRNFHYFRIAAYLKAQPS